MRRFVLVVSMASVAGLAFAGATVVTSAAPQLPGITAHGFSLTGSTAGGVKYAGSAGATVVTSAAPLASGSTANGFSLTGSTAAGVKYAGSAGATVVTSAAPARVRNHGTRIQSHGEHRRWREVRPERGSSDLRLLGGECRLRITLGRSGP